MARFNLNSQGDMLVTFGDWPVDFGYHYHEKLPALLWCSYKQLTGEDLLKEITADNSQTRTDLERTTLEALSNAKALYTTLPRNEDQFNLAVQLGHFGTFTDGTNRVANNFFVAFRRLNLERSYRGREPQQLVLLTPDDHRKFLGRYLKFVTTNEKLKQAVAPRVLYAMSYLKSPEVSDTADVFLELVDKL